MPGQPVTFRRRKGGKGSYPIFDGSGEHPRTTPEGVAPILRTRGHRYQWANKFNSPAEAAAYADKCREAGWRTVVVKHDNECHVYIRQENHTMFGPAKHKKYADIVTFQSKSAADKAAGMLHSEFHDAETRSKQVRVKRVTVLAANRAEASLGRSDLKPATRVKMKQVAKEYRDAASSMTIPPKKDT